MPAINTTTISILRAGGRPLAIRIPRGVFDSAMAALTVGSSVELTITRMDGTRVQAVQMASGPNRGMWVLGAHIADSDTALVVLSTDEMPGGPFGAEPIPRSVGPTPRLQTSEFENTLFRNTSMLAWRDETADPSAITISANVPLAQWFLDSVRAMGVLTPVLCVRVEGEDEASQLYVINGRRRIAAARQLNLPTIPIRVTTLPRGSVIASLIFAHANMVQTSNTSAEAVALDRLDESHRQLGRADTVPYPMYALPRHAVEMTRRFAQLPAWVRAGLDAGTIPTGVADLISCAEATNTELILRLQTAFNDRGALTMEMAYAQIVQEDSGTLQTRLDRAINDYFQFGILRAQEVRSALTNAFRSPGVGESSARFVRVLTNLARNDATGTPPTRDQRRAHDAMNNSASDDPEEAGLLAAVSRTTVPTELPAQGEDNTWDRVYYHLIGAEMAVPAAPNSDSDNFYRSLRVMMERVSRARAHDLPVDAAANAPAPPGVIQNQPRAIPYSFSGYLSVDDSGQNMSFDDHAFRQTRVQFLADGESVAPTPEAVQQAIRRRRRRSPRREG
jgi:hypothetical protein